MNKLLKLTYVFVNINKDMNIYSRLVEELKKMVSTRKNRWCLGYAPFTLHKFG